LTKLFHKKVRKPYYPAFHRKVRKRVEGRVGDRWIWTDRSIECIKRQGIRERLGKFLWAGRPKQGSSGRRELRQASFGQGTLNKLPLGKENLNKLMRAGGFQSFNF
jgi:hypothetical protein